MVTILSRGKPYPLEHPIPDVAVADFLRESGNRLLISLSDITSAEEQVFRYGVIKAGLLYQDGAMLWLFKFYDQDGKAYFVFDAPFDARLVPRTDLQLYSVDNPDLRLLIDLHVVDDQGILRAIRAITMSPSLTLQFLSAVQDQLSAIGGGQQMSKWMQLDSDQLAHHVSLEVLGLRNTERTGD